MKIVLLPSLITVLGSACFAQSTASRPPEKAQIMLLGSTHFGQEGMYKNSPDADLFSQKRQAEVADVNERLRRFNPDLILIEREPEEQHTVDSLYALFKTNRLKLNDLAYGRSEQYQFAFNLGKQLNLDRIYGVDFYNGTSTRILSEGSNIDVYLQALGQFSAKGREVDTRFKAGTLSVNEYLRILNSPEILDLTYRTLLIAPARVREGHFAKPDASIDTTQVDSRYIGAEFSAHFYRRELKIYSNIVMTQLAQRKSRILVVMGQRHAAVLTRIFADDPEFQVVPVGGYLK